jgi:hypothetical protein
MPPPRAKMPPPRVKATGNSQSWNKTRKLMANIFNQFIQTQSSGIKVETDLDLSKVRLAYGKSANEYEEELTNPILWEHLAGFLTETYKIRRGKKKWRSAPQKRGYRKLFSKHDATC